MPMTQCQTPGCTTRATHHTVTGGAFCPRCFRAQARPILFDHPTLPAAVPTPTRTCAVCQRQPEDLRFAHVHEVGACCFPCAEDIARQRGTTPTLGKAMQGATQAFQKLGKAMATITPETHPELYVQHEFACPPCARYTTVPVFQSATDPSPPPPAPACMHCKKDMLRCRRETWDGRLRTVYLDPQPVESGVGANSKTRSTNYAAQAEAASVSSAFTHTRCDECNGGNDTFHSVGKRLLCPPCFTKQEQPAAFDPEIMPWPPGASRFEWGMRGAGQVAYDVTLGTDWQGAKQVAGWLRDFGVEFTLIRVTPGFRMEEVLSSADPEALKKIQPGDRVRWMETLRRRARKIIEGGPRLDRCQSCRKVFLFPPSTPDDRKVIIDAKHAMHYACVQPDIENGNGVIFLCATDGCGTIFYADRDPEVIRATCPTCDKAMLHFGEATQAQNPLTDVAALRGITDEAPNPVLPPEHHMRRVESFAESADPADLAKRPLYTNLQRRCVKAFAVWQEFMQSTVECFMEQPQPAADFTAKAQEVIDQGTAIIEGCADYEFLADTALAVKARLTTFRQTMLQLVYAQTCTHPKDRTRNLHDLAERGVRVPREIVQQWPKAWNHGYRGRFDAGELRVAAGRLLHAR